MPSSLSTQILLAGMMTIAMLISPFATAGQMLSDENKARYLEWFEGNWAEVYEDRLLYGGCNALRTIDYAQFPKLRQRKRSIGGKHTGALAVSASGPTLSDAIYISSGYPHIKHLAETDSLLTGARGPSETKRIPVFLEDGGSGYMQLRLGEEIPGIPSRRIIESNGELIRLVAWGEGADSTRPLLYTRCK